MDFALKSLGAGLSPSLSEYRDPDQVKYRQGHSFRVHMTKKQSQVRKKTNGDFWLYFVKSCHSRVFQAKTLKMIQIYFQDGCSYFGEIELKKIIFSSRPSSKKSKNQKTPKGPIKGDYLIVSIDQNGNEMSELPTGLTIEPSVKGQLADDVTKISFSTKTVQNSNFKIILNSEFSTHHNFNLSY